MSDLDKAIIKTICYFDIFDYPLTLFEIKQNLYHHAVSDLAEIKQSLEELVSNKTIEHKDGFYFLPNRADIKETRLQRYIYSQEKYKKMIRWSRIFSQIPFIRMIAASNTLSFNNVKEKSDIDFFLVVEDSHVWLVRFLVICLTKISRNRPLPHNTKNKFCFSFIISDKNLDLKPLRLKPEDDYFDYWFSKIVPIYNEKNTYENLIDANQWLQESLANHQNYRPGHKRNISQKNIKKFLETFFQSVIWENLARKLQLAMLPANLKQMANQDSRVVINEQVLKFHDKDKRSYYQHLFNIRCNSILKKNYSI